MKSKILATITTIVGASSVLFTLLDEFGIHVTAGQAKAISAMLGVLLLVVGIWFHPDIPVGAQNEKADSVGGGDAAAPGDSPGV